MKCYGMLFVFVFFFLINTFPSPGQTIKGPHSLPVLCRVKAHEINADLPYEHQEKRSDHSSPPKVLGFTWLLLQHDTVVILQVQFAKAEFSFNYNSHTL